MKKIVAKKWEQNQKEIEDLSMAILSEKTNSTLLPSLWRYAIPTLHREVACFVKERVVSRLDMEKMGVAEARLLHSDKAILAELEKMQIIPKHEEEGIISIKRFDNIGRRMGENPKEEDMVEAMISAIFFYEFSRTTSTILYETLVSRLQIILPAFIKKAIADIAGKDSDLLKELEVERIEKKMNMSEVLAEVSWIATHKITAKEVGATDSMPERRLLEIYDRKGISSKVLFEDRKGMLYKFSKNNSFDRAKIIEIYDVLLGEHKYIGWMRQKIGSMIGGETLQNIAEKTLDDFIEKIEPLVKKTVLKRIVVITERTDTKEVIEIPKAGSNKEIEKKVARQTSRKKKEAGRKIEDEEEFDASRIVPMELVKIKSEEEGVEFLIVYSKGVGKSRREHLVAKAMSSGEVIFSKNPKNLNEDIRREIRAEAETILIKKRGEMKRGEQPSLPM